MACLRESSVEGRSGIIPCDEEGCQFRLIPYPDIARADERSPEADRFLQLQLRAGGNENCFGKCRRWGLGRVGIIEESDPPIDLAEYSESESLLEELGPFLDESRRRRVERSQTPTDPKD